MLGLCSYLSVHFMDKFFLCHLDVLGAEQYDSNQDKQTNPTIKTTQRVDILVEETDNELHRREIHYILDGVEC